MVLNVQDAAKGVVAVERPGAEETVKVPAGQPVRIAFDAGSSTMTVENGDLVVRFPDGATIVFEGAGLQLAEAGQTPPQGAPGNAQLAQGFEPGGAEGAPPAELPDLLELSTRELEQLLQIEPAAGAADPDEGDQEAQGSGGDFEAPGLTALEGLSTLGFLSGESEGGSPLPDQPRVNASTEPGEASPAGNPSPSDPPAESSAGGSPDGGVAQNGDSPDLSGGQTPPPPQAANPEEEGPGEGSPGEGSPGEGDPGEGDPGDGDPGEGDPGESDPGESDPGEVGPVGDSEEEPGEVVEGSGPGNGNGNEGNPGNGGGNTGGSGPGSGNGGMPPGQIEEEDEGSESVSAEPGGPGNGNGNTPNSGNGGGNTEGSGPGSGNGGTPPGQNEDDADGPSDEQVGAALQTLGEEPLVLTGFDIAAPEAGGSTLDLSEVIADYDSTSLTYLLQRDGRGWDIAVQVESGSEEGGPVTLAVIDGDSLTDGGASVNLNPSFDAAEALADNIQLSTTGG
jgi:hypothetical protein